MTWLLVVANLAAFAVELTMRSELEPLVRRWGLVPADVVDGLTGSATTSASPAALITLLTSLFLHIGWLHLLTNLLYLAVFGPPVESRLGAPRFALLYLISGLAGGLVYLLAQPASETPAIGASGAIGGVIAAHLILDHGADLDARRPVLFLRVVEGAPTLLLLVVWFAAQLFSSVASLTASTGIAWWAHLGGFASGLALAPLLRTRSR
jgi:membrane associated rhomboid family serine protease